ncbi:MAG: ABC transporter ATP-binding protein [Ignavibacteriales bacterium]|nr:ABC transporter ATP-binding protein [Ignavibacteriales bacterium]
MSTFKLVVRDLGKDFNRRTIFRGLTFSLAVGDSLAITGNNGSGKSTLSKILGGVLSPSKGFVAYFVNNAKVQEEQMKDSVGFVSPYLNLYDEFTAAENLRILSLIRAGKKPFQSRADELIGMVGLWPRRDDPVGIYSSGMKQRLKYAFALLHEPPVLILDEPTSNLDEEGTEVVKEIVRMQKKTGILIVATNDSREAKWCKKKIVMKVAGA